MHIACKMVMHAVKVTVTNCIITYFSWFMRFSCFESGINSRMNAFASNHKTSLLMEQLKTALVSCSQTVQIRWALIRKQPMKKKHPTFVRAWPPASLHWHRVSRCVFFCGQCRDRLSILSVTVAGSPSGTARGGVGGLGGREAPVPVLHHTRVAVWVQDGAFTENTDCDLSPLLLPSRDAKEQHVVMYTVRKSMPVMTPVKGWSRSVSSFGFITGEGL